MRFWGIFRSTDEIEQYGIKTVFTHKFRLPCYRIEKLKLANKSFLYFLSATAICDFLE